MIGSEKKLLMNINKFFLLTYQIGGLLAPKEIQSIRYQQCPLHNNRA